MRKEVERILWIGQCSFQWGRIENGNIGNYYIVEPFVRELHRVFPTAEIFTTNQFTEEFCKRENVKILPLDLYYGFNGTELKDAKTELEIANRYINGETNIQVTPYIQAVIDSDIIIDLSGDMWGDNADLAAKDRFLVGLIKDKIAQMFRPTFMIAGSPGPFDTVKNELEFAKEVFKGFKLVTNREPISRYVLSEYSISIDNVEDYVCPSFLFEASHDNFFELVRSKFKDKNKYVVGLILCGWNFSEGVYSKWPRENSEYSAFVELARYIVENLDCNLYLMSHANGFLPPPEEFKLMHGRDYLVMEQLKSLLEKAHVKNVVLQEEIFAPWQTKAIIGQLDMLVSGRIHGAIAGLSQCVPTVIIDYGIPPKTHKQRGMTKCVGADKYVVQPTDVARIKEIVSYCFSNKNRIKENLKLCVPKAQIDAREQFDRVKEIYETLYEEKTT